MEKIISKLKKDKKINENLIFADIETIIIDNKHIPFSIGWSKNETFNYMYIDDTKDIEKKSHEMIRVFIQRMNEEYKNPTIYFHNMGRFDGILLLKTISILNVHSKIVERNNILYGIELKSNKNTIKIRDSYLMIPAPLKDIGEYFCKKYKKDDIEYNFNEQTIYTDKHKIIEYLKNDVLTLEEGFKIFQNEIFEQFSQDIAKSFSLPSITLKIFRTNFYDVDNCKIFKNTEKMDAFIRKSYFGGIVDVYKPHLKNGYYYDINSLYPYAMLKEMPVGKGKWVYEDIELENFFGFIYAKIIAPDINIPFLPCKIKGKGTLTPIGNWCGIYFSEELKYAKTLGYKIKPIKGIKFEKGPALKNYMEELYSIRKKYEKKQPRNQIAKLLMNTLYGRLGMKQSNSRSKIVTTQELKELFEKHEIYTTTELGDNWMITYDPIRSKKINKLHKKSYNEAYTNLQYMDANTAVHIASAITSYARIHMYQFKNIPNNPCFYTDTDSVFLQNPLEDKYVNNEIGNMKLESIIDEAIFIAPKVYTYNKDKVIFKGISTKDKSINIDWYKDYLDNKQKEYIEYRNLVFSKDLHNLEILVKKNKIKHTIPFNKRIKIIDKDNWTDTKPIKINIPIHIDDFLIN